MQPDEDPLGDWNGGNATTTAPVIPIGLTPDQRDAKDAILAAAINRARSEHPFLAEHWKDVTPDVYRAKRGMKPPQLSVLASFVNKYLGR